VKYKKFNSLPKKYAKVKKDIEDRIRFYLDNQDSFERDDKYRREYLNTIQSMKTRLVTGLNIFRMEQSRERLEIIRAEIE